MSAASGRRTRAPAVRMSALGAFGFVLALAACDGGEAEKAPATPTSKAPRVPPQTESAASRERARARQFAVRARTVTGAVTLDGTAVAPRSEWRVGSLVLDADAEAAFDLPMGVKLTVRGPAKVERSEWAPTSLFVHVGKLSLNAAPMGQSAKSPIRVVVPQATVVLPGAGAVRVDVGTGGEGTLEVSGGSASVWGTVEGGVSDALFIAVAGETWNFGTALERRTPKGGPRHAVVPAFGEAGLAAAISALERELAAEAELTARIDAIGEAQRRREARTPEESADLRRKLVEAVTARRGGQKRLLAAWEHAYLAASMQGPSAAEPRTKVATLGEANRGALRIAAVEPL